LAAAVVALAGCTTPGAKTDSPNAAPRPFTGLALTRPAGRDPSAPPPEVDNLLAGQVIERTFNKRVANASIQIVDLQDPNPAPAARLDVSANADGYFFIPGLQRGHNYQLIARVKDGDRLLSGATLAMPPNPRLSIFLSADYTSPSTPAPLTPPGSPGRASADRDAAPGAPSAVLEPPSKAPPDAPQPPLNRIADSDPGGFPKIPLAPRVEIPNGSPNPILPPPPALRRDAPPPPPSADGAPPLDQASHDGPPPRTAPPFCVLVGKHLDNFGLPALDGTAWEFRRDPPRKLVLLDFWKSNCGPCLQAIPYLRGLQEKYGRDGLEVVGIAYEDPGPRADQVMSVRNARIRTGINYTVLMGADSPTGACPVRSQFVVDSFPRLVLIDGSGEILWRSSAEGMSQQGFKELDGWIDRQLHPMPR
jgi:thiol-disulfide isomerase/thioredoxin